MLFFWNSKPSRRLVRSDFQLTVYLIALRAWTNSKRLSATVGRKCKLRLANCLEKSQVMWLDSLQTCVIKFYQNSMWMVSFSWGLFKVSKYPVFVMPRVHSFITKKCNIKESQQWNNSLCQIKSWIHGVHSPQMLPSQTCNFIQFMIRLGKLRFNRFLSYSAQ